jgi:hypothetical protein
MTPSSLLIGIGSGLASAVLYYSAARGNVWLKLVLFILTPLPALIAGIGWGWIAALAGALAGALLVSLSAGPLFGIGFFLAFGAPCVLLAWLADLGRTKPDGSIDWFPVGDIMAALACYGGAFPVLIAPLFGGSYDILKPEMVRFVRTVFERLQQQVGGAPATDAAVEAWANIMVSAIPPTIAGYWVILFTINLYLAGRVAKASGHLARPWPDLHRLAYPVWFAPAFFAAVALSFAAGTAGIVGSSFSGAFVIAYAFLGLAVLHCISRGRVPWLLWLAYAALLNPFGPYALLAIAVIGFLEPALRLRDRFSKSGPQPPQPPTT